MTAHGLHDATTDEGQITEWWGREPDANIAIATGVAFDVLDIDGDAGFTSLGGALVAYTEPGDPDSFPDGPTISTGKGTHVYFAVTGLGNRAGLLPNVDWRGKGGYVIAPPSIHPDGPTYHYFRGSSDPVFGVDATLPTAPPWLVELIAPKQHVRSNAPVPSITGNITAYARRALESECGRVALAPEGQRNHQLNASSFSLGQLVGGGLLDVGEAIDSLLVAASRAGLDETESRRTIASGLDSGSKQPRTVA